MNVATSIESFSGDELMACIGSARDRGVETYDGLRFRFVLHLAERALDTRSERIARRAIDRLEALEADFDDARVLVRTQLDTLKQRLGKDAACSPALEDLEVRFARGELREVERRALRVRSRGSTQNYRPRLEAQVARRSTWPSPPTDDALALAERLYGERSGEAFTRRAINELRVDLPEREETGPYHGTTVAADALSELEKRARPLLRAWLQRLRNLDATVV